MNYVNLAKMALLVLALSIGFVGCALNVPSSSKETISKSYDYTMTKEIMSSLAYMKTNKNYFANRIVIEEDISKEQGSASESVEHAIKRYWSIYESSSDKIARLYLDIVKNRGNIAKMYNVNINFSIAEITPKPWQIGNELSAANLDVSFIEYDSKNRIKSVLIRVHSFPKTLGISHNRFSIIIFGRLAKKVESRIANKELNNAYITAFK